MCRTSAFVDMLIEDYPVEGVFNNEYYLSTAIGFCHGIIAFIPNWREEARHCWHVLLDQFETGKYDSPQELEKALRKE